MDWNKYIDHTILKPETTEEQVRQVCLEALEYDFAAVCLNPYYVPAARQELEGSQVRVCSVIGFPLGATTTEIKCKEAAKAVENGAAEVDMVINIGALKGGLAADVEEDIARVVRSVPEHVLVKTILECCLLTEREKVEACRMAVSAGADMVKTSTGFNGEGATPEDVQLMRETVGNQAGVKASGGIRDFDTLRKMVNAGATRIGTSSGVAIMKQLRAES